MQFTFQPELVEVNVKEWSPGPEEKVFVREPTAGEYALLENIQAKLHWKDVDKTEKRKIYAEIAIHFARNEQGQLLFSESMITTLAQGSSKPLRRIAMKVAELGRLENEELEELEKNSSGTETTV